MKEKAELNDLGIYELRELARRTGVYSPTTKKSAVLIEEIKQIRAGKLLPFFPTKKLGRPPKNIYIPENLMTEAIIPHEISEIAADVKKEGNIEENALRNFLFKKSCNSLSDEPSTELMEVAVSGYLRRTASNYFYFWNQYYETFSKDKIIYLPENFVKQFSLIDGDKVEGIAKVVDNSNNCYLIKTIEKINNRSCLPDEKRSCGLDTKKVVIPTENIIIFNESIYKGGRAIVYYKDRLGSVVRSIEEVQKLGNDKTKVVFIGTELPPEFIALLSTKTDIESFATRFGDGLENTYNTIINAINHVSALASQSTDVVVVIYDIIGILNVLDLFFNANDNTTLERTANGLQIAKTLFGMGKCIAGGVTITTIATALESEKDNSFISKELSKVVNAFITYS